MNNHFSNIPDEVWPLLEAVCEERLTRKQADRLERLVLADEGVRRLYVDYVALHGTLHWDAALPADSFSPFDEPSGLSATSDPSDGRSSVENPRAPRLRRRATLWAAAAVVGCLLILTGAFAQRLFFAGENSPAVATKDSPETNGDGERDDANAAERNPQQRRPIAQNDQHGPQGSNEPGAHDPPDVVVQKPAPFQPPAGGSALETVVAYVDDQIERQWNEEGIQPSSPAKDYEWVRRAYLDLVGRIPTVDEVERFAQSDEGDKHRRLIDRLLDEPRYVQHQATVWSNLLVGRKPNRDVNRPALEKFLRDSFAQNRPWKDVVGDLIAAEGSVNENGAANFLVAHLNNEAVPATAVTARLFLGVQVQCMQCHNHPFNTGWKQNEFWELNSFFKQTKLERRPRKADDGRMQREAVLTNRQVGGPTFYSTRREVVRAVFPKYGEVKIEDDPSVNRRAELSRLLFDGGNRQVARALVNRVWSQFFGYGFTRPIDDMGPHNLPTHPELLDSLTDEFIASGYDVKRLIRWICNSKAYRLSSRFNDSNRDDDPSVGNHPLFSRMYVKSMSAEQLYDSVLVATRADMAAKGDWDAVARQRREWLQQFFKAYDTEENDESTTFDGTIPQALLMMNGELVQKAVNPEPGTYFHDVLSGSESETQKIRKLALAALSREPTDKESAAFGKVLRRPPPRGVNRAAARAQLMQDVFWAYLNANEFILIH